MGGTGESASGALTSGQLYGEFLIAEAGMGLGIAMVLQGGASGVELVDGCGMVKTADIVSRNLLGRYIQSLDVKGRFYALDAKKP